MIFTLDGLTFNDGNLDDNGVSWGMDVEGWWGAPDVRGSALDLPLRDGSHIADRYRSSRVVSVSGGIVHADVDVTAAALDTLKGALDLVRTDGILIGYEADTPKMLTVRRQAAVDVLWVGSAVQWGTTLVAADWRKYSTTEQSVLLGPYTVPSDGLDLTLDSGVNLGLDESAGSGVDLGVDYTGTPGAWPDAEVSNGGTAVVYPVIEFRGPSSSSMTSFRLSNLTTGDVVSIATTVNAGESLWADMGAAYGIRTGSPVTLGGVTRYGDWASPRTPFGLVPGANVLRFEVLAGTSTNASARVTWRSGWE